MARTWKYVVVVCICGVVALAVASRYYYGTNRKPEESHPEERKTRVGGTEGNMEMTLTEQDENLLSQFFKGDNNHIRKASALCLRKRVTREQLGKLIDRKQFFPHQITEREKGTAYAFAPSQVLVIFYDDKSVVREIHLNGLRVLPDGTTSAVKAVEPQAMDGSEEKGDAPQVR